MRGKPAAPRPQGAWGSLAVHCHARPPATPCLREGDVSADGAFEIRSGDDLPSLAAGASVKIRDHFAHRPVAAGEQQLMELRRVVPPWRGLAEILRPQLRQAAGHPRAVEGIQVARQRGTKADLNAGADRELDRFYTGHRGRAVALGA